MEKLSRPPKSESLTVKSIDARQPTPLAGQHLAPQAAPNGESDRFFSPAWSMHAQKASVASKVEPRGPLHPQAAKGSPSSGIGHHEFGMRAEMAEARTKAFAANEPFFFVVRGKKTTADALKFEEGSSYYRRATLTGNVSAKREAQAYYVSRRDLMAKELGTIEEIESDQNPLAHHLLMVNDDVFCTDSFDKEEHKESLAAASILFDLGKGVERSPAIAILLRGRLPREERADIFGRVFVEALGEKDVEVARACLQYGVTLKSLDREGRDALGELLEPGLEELLDLVCQRTALMTDLGSLVVSRNELEGGAMDGVRRVLDSHIDRLRDSQKG